ncbi:hypothetical protein L9F63_021523, partial [Diploptera punctata]
FILYTIYFEGLLVIISVRILQLLLFGSFIHFCEEFCTFLNIIYFRFIYYIPYYNLIIGGLSLVRSTLE